MSGSHINAEGKFQSDRYPTCPAGKVPLSVTDKTCQDLLWEYAQRRRMVDAEFSADLETCLLKAEFVAPAVPTQIGFHGENGCPLCGEAGSVIVRTGPAIIKEQYKAFCPSSSCANALPASKHQSPAVDPLPATREPATVPPRPRERDKAKLALAISEEHIVELKQKLSEANARIEALESDVAARQIRETDQAARLLKSERSLRESEKILQQMTEQRIADLRKRGQ